MEKEDDYKEITNYEKRLGINHDIKRQKAAFNKAWELRSFEIDKFWQRSIYFWGFIAIIFTGYVYCITSKSSDVVKAMYFDLYIILLGGIFSVAWLLVICGSKQWQDNWEAHIDELENEITGPLYKTVYYKESGYFSVSKINKALTIVVIVVWCFLLIRYIFDKRIMFGNMFACLSPLKEYIFVMLPIIATIVCVIILPTGCKTANTKDKASIKGKYSEFFKRENETQE
jgi:hypothetical protein